MDAGGKKKKRTEISSWKLHYLFRGNLLAIIEILDTVLALNIE